MTLHDPTKLFERHLVFAPDAVAAAADVDLTTDIDLRGVRYVYMMASMGDGDTAVAIQAKTSSSDGGTYANVTGGLISLAATDDNKGEAVLFEANPEDRYLQINVTGTSGTSSDVAIEVLLFGHAYRDEITDPTTQVAENGLS